MVGDRCDFLVESFLLPAILLSTIPFHLLLEKSSSCVLFSPCDKLSAVLPQQSSLIHLGLWESNVSSTISQFWSGAEMTSDFFRITVHLP